MAVSEFEEKLNSILNDPKQMEQITAMAKTLMGGEAQAAPAAKPKGLTEGIELSRLMSSLNMGGGQKDQKRALLEAMKPYLSPPRREKLDRAMKLARMIGMAEMAFGMLGGGDA